MPRSREEEWTLEKILSEYHLWLLKTASRYTKDKGLLDDLVQEGAVAIWKAHQEWTPENRIPLHTFLYNKAKWRIGQVATRGTFTGKPSQRGQNYHTSSTVEHPIDFQVVYDYDQPAPEPPNMMMAYHTQEIVAAINTLPSQQRERIYRYFWLDEPNGRSWAWWNAKRIGARDRLRPQLEHLRDLVR